MYFTLKRAKEIDDKAKECGYFYTAEFATGYMMNEHFFEWICDLFIMSIPILIFMLIIIR